MVLIPVCCPHCQSDQVIKGGTTKAGKQRYKCQNSACPCYSFQLDLTYKGRSPEKETLSEIPELSDHSNSGLRRVVLKLCRPQAISMT